MSSQTHPWLLPLHLAPLVTMTHQVCHAKPAQSRLPIANAPTNGAISPECNRRGGGSSNVARVRRTHPTAQHKAHGQGWLPDVENAQQCLGTGCYTSNPSAHCILHLRDASSKVLSVSLRPSYSHVGRALQSMDTKQAGFEMRSGTRGHLNSEGAAYEGHRPGEDLQTILWNTELAKRFCSSLVLHRGPC